MADTQNSSQKLGQEKNSRLFEQEPVVLAGRARPELLYITDAEIKALEKEAQAKVATLPYTDPTTLEIKPFGL